MIENNMDNPVLINADCLDAMRDMKSNSVDSIVTDPPYGLSFMGKNWDYGVPGKVFWDEAFRIAKPGAYLLAFGGTRTYHRLACAIEDAGWEIKDCIAWTYGSGFPKSMDVSKAIDKALGAERKSADGQGEHEGTINFGMKNRCPKCGKPYFSGNPCTCPREDKITITEEAKRWQGWGTCLKPAFEPIIMARKPLEGTVANNVLKYGTGGLNIDACRVPTEDNLNGGAYCKEGNRGNLSGDNRDAKGAGMFAPGKTTGTDFVQPFGRFPANFVHDGSDEVLKLFPNTGKSYGGGKHTKGKGDNTQGNAYGTYGNGDSPDEIGFGDYGSAARFFYCAKASKAERGEGNNHPTVKPLALMKWLVTLVTPPNGTVLDPFMGSGTTGIVALELNKKFIGIERDEHYFEIAQNRIMGGCEKTSSSEDNSEQVKKPQEGFLF